VFDPDEVTDLHDCFGNEFEKRFIAYERKAERGAMRFGQKVNAVDLWHEILTSVALSGEGDVLASRTPWAFVPRACIMKTRCWPGRRN